MTNLTDYSRHILYPHDVLESGKDTVAPLRAIHIRRRQDDILEASLKTVLSNRERNMRSPNSEEKMGIVVYGHSGAGKSDLLKKVLGDEPKLSELGRYGMVSLKLRAPVRLANAGHQVVSKMGYPSAICRPSQDYWSQIPPRAAELGTAALHLDEAQDAFRQNRAIADTWMQTFKALMDSEQPLAVLLSGTPAMRPYFETGDPQSSRRMIEIELPSISYAANAKGVAKNLDKYCASAKITNGLAGTDYERLMRAAGYQFGRTFSLAISGIREAILAKSDTLQLVHLAHAFERDVPKTAPAHNFFWVPHYMQLDPFGGGLLSDVSEESIKRKSQPRENGKW